MIFNLVSVFCTLVDYSSNIPKINLDEWTVTLKFEKQLQITFLPSNDLQNLNLFDMQKIDSRVRHRVMQKKSHEQAFRADSLYTVFVWCFQLLFRYVV